MLPNFLLAEKRGSKLRFKRLFEVTLIIYPCYLFRNKRLTRFLYVVQ